MSKHDPFNTHLVTCAKPESAVSLYLSGSLSHSRIKIKKKWSTGLVSDCDLRLLMYLQKLFLESFQRNNKEYYLKMYHRIFMSKVRQTK